MSDIDIMAAIIEKYAEVVLETAANRGTKWRCTSDSALVAARALKAAGFNMGGIDIDDKQDGRLADLEKRVAHLEGYTNPFMIPPPLPPLKTVQW